MCTDLNQEARCRPTHLCLFKTQATGDDQGRKTNIEIGCWSSGQPRPLLANPLMPSEKQITNVTIKQLSN